MTFRFALAAGAFALAATAHTPPVQAQEAEAAPIVLTLAPAAAGSLAASFQRSVDGFFLDTFTFNPASVAGRVAVSFTPVSGTINFFSALLGGTGFGFDPDLGSTTFSFETTVTADKPLELQLLGFAGNADDLTGAAGSYRGTVTVSNAVAAIPEPSTVVLMLAGLALLGAVATRSRARAQPLR